VGAALNAIVLSPNDFAASLARDIQDATVAY
jgi:hypothetical protein